MQLCLSCLHLHVRHKINAVLACLQLGILASTARWVAPATITDAPACFPMQLQEACKRGRQMSQRISDADKQSTAMVQQLVSVHSLLLEMTTQRDNLQTELLAVRQCLAVRP